jgi:hypothetical protein
MGVADLNPRKLWEIRRAGDSALGKPAEPRVAADGTLYVRDFEYNVSHIFSASGEFLGSFARQGDERGEIPRYLNCFLVDGMVVIGTPTALHFFTRAGEFIRSAPNDLFRRFPLVFLNEHEFLCAPGALTGQPGEVAHISKVDLRTGAVEMFDELPLPGDPPTSAGGPSVVVIGLTPMIEMAYDATTQRLYYGRSDDYTIHVSDLTGRRVSTFGLDRPRGSVSIEEKREHLALLDLPEEHLAPIIASLPDKLTYYHQIRTHDGLIYVFAATGISRQAKTQKIDIFSANGDYLYRSQISIDDGRHICGSADNVIMQGESLYVILEDDDGRRSIVKYQLDLSD